MADELTQVIHGAVSEAGLLDGGAGDGEGGGDRGDGGDTHAADDGDGGDDLDGIDADALDDDGTTSDDDDAGDASDDDEGAGAGETGADDDAADASKAKGQDGKGDSKDKQAPPTRESKPTDKKGPIPFPRHEEIIRNIRDEYEHPETGKYTRAVKELRSLEWARDPETLAAVRLLQIANDPDNGPEKFAKLLVQNKTLAKHLALRGSEEAVRAPSSATSKVGEMPKPNRTYKDPESGQEHTFYDNDGITALMQWAVASAEERAAQAAEKARKELSDEYDEKYGPVIDSFKAASIREGQVAQERANIAHAREHWRGFKQYEEDIKAYVFKPGNEKVNLFDAYLAVVPAKLEEAAKADKAAVRKEILAELKKKSKAAVRHTNRAPAPDVEAEGGSSADGDPITAAIRGAVRRARLT